MCPESIEKMVSTAMPQPQYFKKQQKTDIKQLGIEY